MRSYPRLVAPFAILAAAALAPTVAHAQSTPFSDATVQAPELGTPERGSMVGALAHAAFGVDDVARGIASLPFPITVPSERGKMSGRPFPAYSAEGGIGEWGMGWQAALAITRWRAKGDVDYGSTDELSGPWGPMARGADGAWYAHGGAGDVRLEEQGDDRVAYLPDGSRWTFGGAEGLRTSRGTYAWYLREVESAVHQKTRYAYDHGPSGRPYLRSVMYGGSGDAFTYQVKLDYEALPTPLRDFRSGQLVTLDQRVRTVTMLAQARAGGALVERWHQTLTYAKDAFGPAFFLQSVTQTFPSGESAPATTYTYGAAADQFSTGQAQRAPKLDDLLTKYGADVIQPNRAAALDADADGRPDLELGFDGRLLRQTDAGFAEETLAQVASDADPLCRPAASPRNDPRVVARMRGRDAPYDVLGFVVSASHTATSLHVCTREGTPLQQLALTGDWKLGPGVKLVDVSRDQQPDLVRVHAGGYDVLPNTSTATTFGFGPVQSGVLSPSFVPEASWVHDFNGDGIADLVARSSMALVVWFGKGNYQFEPNGVTFALRSATGPLTTLKGYTLTFVDANRDGATDVLLGRGSSLLLMVNDGTALVETPVKAFNTASWLSSRPVVLDLGGTGNTAIAYVQSNQGFAFDLAPPEVSLLRTASDGKGTVLGFAYERAKVFVGAHRRSVVVSRVDLASTGYDPVSYSYEYDAPRLHSSGCYLLGYDQVTRHGAESTERSTFLNADRISNLLLATTEHDDHAPDVERVTFREYEDLTLAGVPWKRLKSEGNGWRSTNPLAPTVSLDQKEYLAYADAVCPATVRQTTASGTLTTAKEYAHLASFAKGLSCVEEHVVLTGQHADPTFDFRHEARIARNAAGQAEHLTMFDRGGVPLVSEDVTYTPEGKVASIAKPGQGTALFTYASGLLARTTLPDGVVSEALDRDPLTDALRARVVRHGDLALREDFRFDGQERLSKSWNDMGGASETNPDVRLAYRYASGVTPAMTSVETLAVVAAPGAAQTTAVRTHTADLATAAGEILASGTRIPEGWALGDVTSRSRATRSSRTFRRAPSAADVATLDTTSLFSGASATGSAESSLFGVDVHGSTAMHAGVSRSLDETLSLGATLTRTTSENGTVRTVTREDATRHTLGVTDATGAAWSYRYDALGRLRLVTLPDGTKHKVDLDDYGHSTRIARDGVATVTSTFDRSTGLLATKTFRAADTGSSAGRTVRFTRDLLGRVTNEEHVDLASGISKSFVYFFDGTTPANPSGRTRPGLLSAVAGPGFLKTFTYRADGSLASKRVVVDGLRTLDTAFQYDEDGQPSGRTVTVTDASTGKIVSTTAQRTVRDAYGRASAVTLDGAPFSTMVYDVEVLPLWARFVGDAAHDEVVTLSHDPLTRQRTGMNQSDPKWAAAVSARRNERGLIAYDDITVSGQKRHRVYQYGPQGYLTDARDEAEHFAYGFGVSGLPTSITREVGSATMARPIVAQGVVLDGAGHHHAFDGLGRAVERDDVQIAYGPDGQIDSAHTAGKAWTYIHDEHGRRLAKKVAGKVVAIYPEDGGVLDMDHGLVEPVRVDGSVVGVLRHGVLGTAEKRSFQLLAVDRLGTVISDADGTARLASPLGERDVHPDLAAAIDYATKGYDADLGTVRMGVRDYDPRFGRFLTPDPLYLESVDRCIAHRVDCNLYTYARNDAALFVDPDGTDPPGDAPSDPPRAAVTLGVTLGGFLGLGDTGAGLGGEVGVAFVPRWDSWMPEFRIYGAYTYAIGQPDNHDWVLGASGGAGLSMSRYANANDVTGPAREGSISTPVGGAGIIVNDQNERTGWSLSLGGAGASAQDARTNTVYLLRSAGKDPEPLSPAAPAATVTVAAAPAAASTPEPQSEEKSADESAVMRLSR